MYIIDNNKKLIIDMIQRENIMIKADQIEFLPNRIGFQNGRVLSEQDPCEFGQLTEKRTL